MAFAAATLTSDQDRAFSVGPLKIEIQSFSCLSTDTSGTVTAQRLYRVDQVILCASGTLCQTSAPSISGVTATLAMSDPAAACTGYVAKTINGYVLLLGR